MGAAEGRLGNDVYIDLVGIPCINAVVKSGMQTVLENMYLGSPTGLYFQCFYRNSVSGSPIIEYRIMRNEWDIDI